MPKFQMRTFVDCQGSLHCATVLLVSGLHTELWGLGTLKGNGDRHIRGQLNAGLVQAE